jgi:murein DD-endopeptidase MepM/ murein hydrolase activator NlpD
MPVAVTVASLSVCAGAASGTGGGIAPPDPPQLKDVICVSTCGGLRKATTDSKVQLTGRHLDQVNAVLLNSKSGGRIRVDPLSVGSRVVTATVPEGAATGRPKVTDPFDDQSRSPQSLTVVPPDRIPSTASYKLKDAKASPRKSYYYGTRQPKVTYLFTSTEPTDVRIDVVRRADGTVVDSWVRNGQVPNAVHTATWDGTRDGSRKPARNGSYRFRIGPESGTMESTTESTFSYHRFKFPIRGRHSYGDGVGAPRVGHIHQGQDLAADCGTPLVAARGGRVQWRSTQAGGAGNYVVIDGKRTGHDWVYMHLKHPAKPRRGDRVRTGERIGRIGATGDATGCHLHIEEWSAPGWYEGGHFLASITRHLKRWDRWS